MQTKGIQEMRQIEASNKYLNSKNDIRLYTNKYLLITKNMIYKMSTARKSYNIDLNFINEMIPHHKGAVKMCNNLLKYDINPELVIVAKDIIKEQTEGIEMLTQLRKNICKNK